MTEIAPDMAQMQRDGVPLKKAIEICEAWQKAHPPEPEPGPIVAEHVLKAEPKPMLQPKPAVQSQLDALPRWAPKLELNLSCYLPPPRPKPLEEIANIDKPALGRPVVNEPAKPVVEEIRSDTDRILSLSLLHTLVEQINSARPDPTLLSMEGFTSATATEICDFIRRGNAQ